MRSEPIPTLLKSVSEVSIFIKYEFSSVEWFGETSVKLWTLLILLKEIPLNSYLYTGTLASYDCVWVPSIPLAITGSVVPVGVV